MPPSAEVCQWNQLVSSASSLTNEGVETCRCGLNILVFPNDNECPSGLFEASARVNVASNV